ncbi:hypothetical protein OG589_14835 [Sphaerisporangium sp. NBC_01403]|uniref:hypothetical protein n=1 Tax=Sphaerisporangium sp. NBC_01403 TaxID=2903599 RepID=UPI0032569510
MALVVEGVTDTLNAKGFAVLCVVAALTPVLAAIRAHSERMEHALQRHAELVAKHETWFNNMSDLISRAIARARIDGADSPSNVNTGPFPIFDRRIG